MKTEKKDRGNRWNTGGGKHISTLGAISAPLPPLHPTPCLYIPSLPLSWLCHPSWEWVPQRHADCRSQRQKTPSSSCSANQSRSKNTLLQVERSFSLSQLFMCQGSTFSGIIKGDETTQHVFRKVFSSTMSWVNKAALAMLLLAMEHVTQATDKGEVTERIQYEDNLQHCLSHTKCGQRGVPNGSILEERDK